MFPVEFHGDMLKCVYFAGGENGADEGTHAGARYAMDGYIEFLKGHDDADVGPAACASAAEYQADFFL